MINLINQLKIVVSCWSIVLITLIFVFPATLPHLQAGELPLKNAPFDLSSLPDYPIQLLPAHLNLTTSFYTSLDVASGKFLISNNTDMRRAPASTAKLALIYVAMKKCSLNQIITVAQYFNIGTILGTQIGEKFSFKDLLYAMLLPSDNDAAVAVADGCFGSQQAAVLAMNNQIKNWGLHNTHFVNPDGLDAPGNYTTPRDLAEIANIVISNPVVAAIADTPAYSITSIDGTGYTLISSNELLGKDGFVGIKTGSTALAGENFIGLTNTNSHMIITVVLGSTDRFSDTEKLLMEIRRVYSWQVESNINLGPVLGISNAIK